MLELFDKKLSDVEADSITVGGFVFDRLGTIPEKGETLVAEGLEFKVQKIKDRRIHSLIVKEIKETEGIES